MILLSKLKRVMDNQLTFKEMVGQIIKDFNTEYRTIGSLQKIVNHLDELSGTERAKYSHEIDRIKNTIKGYGSLDKDKVLTDRQSARLQSILYKATGTNIIFQTTRIANPWAEIGRYQPPQWSRDTNYYLNQLETSQRSSSDSSSETTSSSSTTFPTGREKLAKDSVMYSVIHGLIDNLQKNVMTSTLVKYVIEYFEISESLIEAELDDSNLNYPQTLEVSDAVLTCLRAHGWNSRGGFNRAPEPKVIVRDLKKIVGDYF